MTDILLVFPPNSLLYSPKSLEVAENSSPPLGISYLASFLREEDFSVAIADLHVDSRRPKDIGIYLEKFSPKVVGISSNTIAYPTSRTIIREVRKYDKSIPIILGGMHPSALPEDVLKENDADFVVRGEGEITLWQLLRYLLRGKTDLGSINGLTFKKQGRIFHNPEQSYIQEIDRIPFPARDLLSLDKYIQKGSILSSRGCPIKCIFCACGTFFGHSYRMRSAENIIEEIESMIRDFGIKQFTFQDDTLTKSSKRVKAICELIIKKGWRIEWGCQSRVNGITEAVAEVMAESGCKAIQLGVESGSQEILDQCGKKIKLSQVVKAVQIARKSGIDEITCSFIIGHPGDTEKAVCQTIDFAKYLREIGATHTPFTIMTPLPGTEIFLHPQKYGITILDHRWEEFTFSRVHIETQNLSKKVLEKLYFDALMDALSLDHDPLKDT
jgi:anaerobic magnesium-protoporphyrin IX monomethyl ester cyclase